MNIIYLNLEASRRVGAQIQYGWRHNFKKGGGTNSRMVGAQIPEGWGYKFQKGWRPKFQMSGRTWRPKFQKGRGTIPEGWRHKF